VRPAVSLDAYRKLTLAGSVLGAALFGAGLVALVQLQQALAAAALMAAGMLAALATAALDIEGAPPALPPSLLLYTRPACALCDEARALLGAMRAEVAFDLWEVDVSGEPELEAQYGEAVPVGVVAGREVFRLQLDEPRVRAALRG
jgi:hypothetical protein